MWFFGTLLLLFKSHMKVLEEKGILLYSNVNCTIKSILCTRFV